MQFLKSSSSGSSVSVKVSCGKTSWWSPRVLVAFCNSVFCLDLGPIPCLHIGF